jgi:hypothetical protein
MVREVVSNLVILILIVVVAGYEEDHYDHNHVSFLGGSECYIQNKQYANEYLYPISKFNFQAGHKTVCLKSLGDPDAVNKISWRIERASVSSSDDETFFLKRTSLGKEEFLCSVMSYFDILTKRHELKRLSQPSKVDRENCEWKIEPILAENPEDPIYFTIKNQAHREPIFADLFHPKLLLRSVGLRHVKSPAILSDNYKWLIECE